MKQEPTHVLLQAIRCVGKGEVFIRPEIEATVTKQAASNSKGSPANELDCLTDREIEVLQLMAEGKNRREIAKTMGLSVKTIEGYRENMKRKLSLRDTVQLAQFAVRMIDSFNV